MIYQHTPYISVTGWTHMFLLSVVIVIHVPGMAHLFGLISESLNQYDLISVSGFSWGDDKIHPLNIE